MLRPHHPLLRPAAETERPPRPGSRPLAITALALAALLPAPSGVVGAGVLEPFGLEGRVVTSLATHGSLYAGTIGDGVFRRDLANSQATWAPLGLEGKPIRAVYPHASGPLGFATTIGIQNDPLHPDSVLVYCSEMDQPPWTVADSGMVRADVYGVWSLDGFPSPAICGETFAGTIGPAGGVWRRPYDRTHWEYVLNLGFGVCNVVRVNPWSGDVWAGGENAVLAPWIARSTDAGDTWQVTYLDLAGDNACNAIAVHPDDPDVAYAGMEGPVLKTMDGGATWQPTGLAASQAYIYGVALDSGMPTHLLAGGMVQDPNNWALWESADAGQTWSEVPPPVPGTRGISSIVADPTRRGTFYIATFGHGVWRYRHVVAGIDDPPGPLPFGLAFGRIYPNPTRAFTTIEFEIPPSLAAQPVVLGIYSLRGDLVCKLVSGVIGAGPHRITWNGEDSKRRRVAPGVYFAGLRVGPHLLRRTLAVVR